jgi:arylsulfatase A-like enzyme
MVARWPGRIAAAATTDHPSAFWDVLPTVMDLIGAETPRGLDGISFAPTLLGEGEQATHDAMYWELGRQQAVRQGDWKLIRRWDRQGRTTLFLFDLAGDPSETTNLAPEEPARVARLLALMATSRTPSAEFPLRVPVPASP